MAMDHKQKDSSNLEDNVPAETLPGTEVMVDRCWRRAQKQCLVPQPSNDPDDPLASSYITHHDEARRANVPVATKHRIGAHYGSY